MKILQDMADFSQIRRRTAATLVEPRTNASEKLTTSSGRAGRELWSYQDEGVSWWRSTLETSADVCLDFSCPESLWQD
jgi:hypothetical protein